MEHYVIYVDLPCIRDNFQRRYEGEYESDVEAIRQNIEKFPNETISRITFGRWRKPTAIWLEFDERRDL